jgi:hypothetical protein
MFLNVGSKYKDVMDFLSTETFLTEKAKAAMFIPALSSANNSESIRSGRPSVQRAQYRRDPAEKYGEAVSPEQILLDCDGASNERLARHFVRGQRRQYGAAECRGSGQESDRGGQKQVAAEAEGRRKRFERKAKTNMPEWYPETGSGRKGRCQHGTSAPRREVEG